VLEPLSLNQKLNPFLSFPSNWNSPCKHHGAFPVHLSHDTAPQDHQHAAEVFNEIVHCWKDCDKTVSSNDLHQHPPFSTFPLLNEDAVSSFFFSNNLPGHESFVGGLHADDFWPWLVCNLFDIISFVTDPINITVIIVFVIKLILVLIVICCHCTSGKSIFFFWCWASTIWACCSSALLFVTSALAFFASSYCCCFFLASCAAVSHDLEASSLALFAESWAIPPSTVHCVHIHMGACQHPSLLHKDKEQMKDQEGMQLNYCVTKEESVLLPDGTQQQHMEKVPKCSLQLMQC